MKKKLAFFDFDGTLFRSPEPPWFVHKKWYSQHRSLGEPFVPNNPPEDWWVPQTLEGARRAIGDPQTHTVLCTGRILRFEPRILYLLNTMNLHFDEVHLCPGGPSGATERFKRGLLRDLVRKNDFESIAIYEDRPHLAESYADLINRTGIPLQMVLVTVPAHPVACSFRDVGSWPQKKSKPLYTGIFFPPDSQRKLFSELRRHRDKLPTGHGNHLTLRYKPKENEFGDNFFPGGVVQVKVFGVSVDPWINTFQVSGVCEGGKSLVDYGFGGTTPHITMETDHCPPKESNIVTEWELIPSFSVTGIMGISDGETLFTKGR